MLNRQTEHSNCALDGNTFVGGEYSEVDLLLCAFHLSFSAGVNW